MNVIFKYCINSKLMVMMTNSDGDNITINVIQDSEILVPNQVTFKLRAVINHSGSFGKGHYWSNVRYSGSEKWIICNDKAIIVDHNQKKVLDPLHPYVLIYTKV